MLRRAFASHHFTVYQSVLTLVCLVAVIRIICDYSWAQSAGYGATTFTAFWLGQGIITLAQRTTKRSRSLD